MLKKILLSTLFVTCATVNAQLPAEPAFTDTITYKMRCDEVSLPYGSENENMDGDIYINFEEYALGLNFNSADAYGADHLTISDNQGEMLYPNPAHSIVIIESEKKLQQIEICDLRRALLETIL